MASCPSSPSAFGFSSVAGAVSCVATFAGVSAFTSSIFSTGTSLAGLASGALAGSGVGYAFLGVSFFAFAGAALVASRSIFPTGVNPLRATLGVTTFFSASFSASF